MPIDLWGSASSVSGDRLVMVGGITNKGSELTNESIAYDPVEDTWSRLPTPPYTFYRSTGVCGFTRIGGADNRAWGVTEVARLPMAGDCGQAHDRAWLRTVRSGTVPADRSRSVTVGSTRGRSPGPGCTTPTCGSARTRRTRPHRSGSAWSYGAERAQAELISVTEASGLTGPTRPSRSSRRTLARE